MRDCAETIVLVGQRRCLEYFKVFRVYDMMSLL